MNVPNLLQDLIRLLMNLSTVVAIGCLVLAGINLHREGGMNFHIGGGFTKWVLWAVIFVTLPQILNFFTVLGLTVPVPGGDSISASWLRAIENDLSSFIDNVVLSRLVRTLAAFFVLRAILDSADGGHPLPPILTAMFLLAVPTIYSLVQSFNTGSTFAAADVLDSLWNYLAGQIMPIAAGLAVIGAIINFARQRPAMRLVLCSLAFLSVSALWRLVLAMM